MRSPGLLFSCVALIPMVPGAAVAGDASVVAATAVPEGEGGYRLEVTLRHADEGWDHYADRWEVLAPDGRVLATRTLLHPHVQEQPFTRGLSHVRIPPGIHRVTIRAHDSVHGDSPRTLELQLPDGPAAGGSPR